ncbi:MAG: dienelactone hydrolase family protein [Chitinophagaceae bacterium]
MKQYRAITVCILAVISLFSSCKLSDKKKEPEMKEPKLKEENITYSPAGMDSLKLDGYIVYDENKEGKRPAVLVVHEWWGINDYVKMRARELAKLGYIAMAVDMYGNGKKGDNPDVAGQLAGPFYQNPAMAKPLFDAALSKLMAYSQADRGNVAAIGYCFGGAQVINLAKMGEDLKGVVSFHGNLTVMPVNKELLKAHILVCHGADDTFVPASEVNLFKAEMDSAGAKYTFKSYKGATHSFTNPNSTAMGEKFNIPIKYNAAADSASWQDMQDFFKAIFK